MTHGAFIWYDLMTTDLAGAEAFYGSVMGWTAADSGMPDAPAYTLFKAGDRPSAGLMDLPQELLDRGVPPCWNGYVGVDDVDAAAAAYAADGGVIREGPQDIPGVGRFAVAADPQGAIVSLFKGMGEMTPPDPRTPGFVAWRELITTDAAAAFDFYARQFGWSKLEAIDMKPMGGVYQIFGYGDLAIGGMMDRPAQIPWSYWGFYFMVEDVEIAAGKVKAGGGQVLNGPMPVPGGDIVAQCRDPQGAYFSIVSSPKG